MEENYMVGPCGNDSRFCTKTGMECMGDSWYICIDLDYPTRRYPYEYGRFSTTRKCKGGAI